jgi:ferrous iron transport protein B
MSTALETKKVTIAVAGNPNCGKTTLFNGLTGGKQRIGNWPGVTVEKKEGSAKYNGQILNFIDLPGIYSLSAFSEDEKIARDYILSGEPDLVINIVDATNLERNLFLTTHLIEMKVPVLVVLNMMDLAEKQSLEIDIDLLSKTLGLPVVGISAINGKDIEGVKKFISDTLAIREISQIHIEYPNEVEEVVSKWSPKLTELSRKIGTDERWIAIKLLEGDEWITEQVVNQQFIEQDEIEQKLRDIEKTLKESADVVLADYKYGSIHGIFQKVVRKKRSRESITDRVDKVVMNRFLGIPIFLAVIYLVFWVTINVGGAFIDFFDIFFGAIFVDGLGALLSSINTPNWLITIIAGGIGAGIQTVSTFIPIIFTMFLMLSLLEDSGYMARAAFVMDRFMRWIGLPGKSFIPMLVGFGCTIPAVMATRTLENKKDRYMTVFMAPFMSCGARLPVYALFAAAFFPAAAGNIVFSLYLVGIILAILTGLLLKGTLFKGELSQFIMELPPYHAPRFKHIMIHTWNRLKMFMFRAGKYIIIIVALLSFFNSLGIDGTFGNEDSENSVLARVGMAITPVFTPMGIEKDNWPASVAVFTGLFAKEAVVGTLNSLYSQMDAAEKGTEEDEEFHFWAGIGESFRSIPEGFLGIFGSLSDPVGAGIISGDEGTVAEELEMDEHVFTTMRKYFSFGGPQAYAYLLFILIYFPCIAAFGAIIREIGKGLGILSMVYLTILGWIVATLFFQITVAHQLIWIIIPLLMMGGIYALFAVLGRKVSRADLQ